MAEGLLLQGRYFNKLRKLGMMGLGASVVSGVAAYYAFYVRRSKVYSDFEKNALVPEMQKKVDDRLWKLSGFERDEKYPNMAFPKRPEEGSVEELAREMGMVEEVKKIRLEARIMSELGEDALKNYCNYYVDDFSRSGIFPSEAEREKARKKFVEDRKKFLKKYKTMDKPRKYHTAYYNAISQDVESGPLHGPPRDEIPSYEERLQKAQEMADEIPAMQERIKKMQEVVAKNK